MRGKKLRAQLAALYNGDPGNKARGEITEADIVGVRVTVDHKVFLAIRAGGDRVGNVGPTGQDIPYLLRDEDAELVLSAMAERALGLNSNRRTQGY